MSSEIQKTIKVPNFFKSNQTLQWLTEFLGNRLQTLVVEGAKSSFSVVLSGVPQGTVLGPILFILYIDDQLDILVTALGKVFADDTKLVGKNSRLGCQKSTARGPIQCHQLGN